MSINAASSTSSASLNSASAMSQVSTTSNTDSAKKSSTDSSFKEEMDKVSTKDQEKDKSKVSEDQASKDAKVTSNEKNSTKPQDKVESERLEAGVDYSDFASVSMLDANNMLSRNIEQMYANEFSIDGADLLLTQSKSDTSLSTFVSMDKSDADFFLGLTHNNDVSMQNIVSQAQNMLNNGAEIADVKQNVQVSQTLLNALSNARETNQPLRIDFDQNVSVILRINKEGVISANFIPGDKAVEQYLRNNIETLKASFRENDLPYSDLSYSNRGSKQQKENRKNNEK